MTARAQDLGTLLRGIGQVRNMPAGAQELFSTMISIAEVSTGTANPSVLADQNTDGKVILYRTATCGYCKQAAAYMQSQQISFAERDVDKNSGYKAELKRLGGRGVPLMVMGDKTLIGFSQQAFDRSYAEFKSAKPAGQYGLDAAMASSEAKPATAMDASASTLRSGNVLVSKIAGVALYREPGKTGARVATLGRADEVVFMGEEQNGMYRVTSAKGEGWVDRLLMRGL